MGGTTTVIPKSAKLLALNIDRTFLEIALSVPTEVKDAPSGQRFTLYERPETGVLQAIYMGNFTLRVLMRAEGYGGDLAMWKDYALRDYKKCEGGMPHETEQINPADLLYCPAPLTELEGLITALHTGYMQKIARDPPVQEVHAA